MVSPVHHALNPSATASAEAQTPPGQGSRIYTKSLHRRLLLPLIAIQILGLIALGLAATAISRARILDELEQESGRSQILFHDSLGSHQRLLRAWAQQIARDPEVRDALRHRAREPLAPLARQWLNRTNRLEENTADHTDQLTFVAPDQTVLLRTHAPTRFGDKIAVPAAAASSPDGICQFGAEDGLAGPQIFLPVFDTPADAPPTLLGYVILGHPVDTLATEFRAAYHADLCILIPKDRLRPEVTNPRMRADLHVLPWDYLPGHLVTTFGHEPVPPNFTEALAHVRDNTLPPTLLHNDDRTFVVTGFPIPSADAVPAPGTTATPARPAARPAVAIMIYDRSDEVARDRAHICIVLTVGVGVCGFVSLLFYGLICRVEKHLGAAEARLTAESRKLRHSQYLFQLVVDNIPQLIAWKDTNSVYLGCNKNFALAAGVAEPSAILGKTDYDLAWTRSEADAYRKGDHLVLDSAQPMTHVAETQTQSTGRVASMDASKMPLLDGDGQVIGVVATFEDITERKRTDEALRLTQFSLDRAGEAAFWIGPDGHFMYANEAACRLLGYPRDQLHNLSVRQIDVALSTVEWNVFWQQLRNAGAHTCETWLRARDGRLIPVEKSINYLAFNNKEFYCAFVRDITERKKAEEALRESEERYALAARGANDGLWDWNLKTQKIYYSPRWINMLGYADDEIAPTPAEWTSRIHPDDLERFNTQVAEHLAGRAPLIECEYRIRCKDASYRWMLCRGVAVRDPAGAAYRMAGSQKDITDRRLAEEKLRHDALHDTLTGLPNRNLLLDRLAQAITRSKRSAKHKFAVLFLDFDRFKVINDSLGHTLGDQLLCDIAVRLHQTLRTADTITRLGEDGAIARLGGDEFTILLDGVQTIADAILVANRIQSALQEPFHLGGHEVFCTASVGIAFSDTGYERPDEVLRDADTAMYRAKTTGKAKYEVFDRAMHARAVARLEIENDLRRAIDRQEFEVHYQPIVTLENGRLHGFEALVRWRHPAKGLIRPDEFIPIAEETGTILQIGQWVLREACTRLRDWQVRFPRETPLRMSVNLSRKQLREHDLVDKVQTVLRECQLPPRTLKLEVTESIVMENAEQAAKLMAQLRELKVQLDLDDFGTVYSSLSCLRRFPLDGIKIDRTFINNVGPSFQHSAILQAIITLAHSLRMKVVAEGIETPEQIAQLMALECDYVQGYYLGKPVPAPDAEKVIETDLKAGHLAFLQLTASSTKT